MRTCPLQERRFGFGCLSNTHGVNMQGAGPARTAKSRSDKKKKKKVPLKTALTFTFQWMRQYAHTDVKMGERERCSCAWEGAAVRQGLLKESS